MKHLLPQGEGQLPFLLRFGIIEDAFDQTGQIIGCLLKQIAATILILLP
jgi:hypothetical protein